VLLLGVKALAVPGEETNIKITSSLDWEIARKIIAPLLEKDRKGRSSR
jgi:2-C-methyl-D-erythritol 4-phosphate cytidylyltransferase